jgi:hypothetical protein
MEISEKSDDSDNFASIFGGARILERNSGCQYAESILNYDNDK